MKRIVILDQRTGKIFIREITKQIEQEGEIFEDLIDYFEDELKIHSSDCSWMITDLKDYLDDNTKL